MLDTDPGQSGGVVSPNSPGHSTLSAGAEAGVTEGQTSKKNTMQAYLPRDGTTYIGGDPTSINNSDLTAGQSDLDNLR